MMPPIHPLKEILESQPDTIDTCTNEMFNFFLHGALSIACNKPLNKDKAMISYLIKAVDRLTPEDPAHRACLTCLKQATPNRVARTFATYFVFYLGELPYRGAKPMNAAVRNANTKIHGMVNG